MNVNVLLKNRQTALFRCAQDKNFIFAFVASRRGGAEGRTLSRASRAGTMDHLRR